MCGVGIVGGIIACWTCTLHAPLLRTVVGGVRLYPDNGPASFFAGDLCSQWEASHASFARPPTHTQSRQIPTCPSDCWIIFCPCSMSGVCKTGHRQTFSIFICPSGCSPPFCLCSLVRFASADVYIPHVHARVAFCRFGMPTSRLRQ